MCQNLTQYQRDVIEQMVTAEYDSKPSLPSQSDECKLHIRLTLSINHNFSISPVMENLCSRLGTLQQIFGIVCPVPAMHSILVICQTWKIAEKLHNLH